MLLFSTILIFFNNGFMNLSLFHFSLGMILFNSLKNILAFLEPSKFFLSSFLYLRSFCLCNIFMVFFIAASVFYSSFSFQLEKMFLHLQKL